MRISFKKNSVYKWSCVVDTITSLLSIYMLLCFWNVLYAKAPDQASYMAKYAVLTTMIHTVLTFATPSQLAYRIRSGDMCIDILKPWNLIISYFFDDLGANLVKCITKMIPVLLISILFIVNIFVSVGAVIFLVISTILSMVIIFLSRICVSMICFWITEAWSFQILFNTIILVLSGRMIPSWIYPKEVERIFHFFPYIWTLQKPVDMYFRMDSTRMPEVFSVLLVQGLWIAVLGILTYAIWSRAYRKLIIQGG